MAGVTEAYLDNSATTKPTQSVINAVVNSMREGFYNPSSQYAPAVASEKHMEETREAIAGAIHATASEILFTSGGTEANNLVVLSTAALQREKAHFIVNATEHPSVLAAFEEVAKLGHRVTVLPVQRNGLPDYEAFARAVEDKPALVSCMQVNNETGAMADIPRMVKIAQGANPKVLFHVDGVQGFLRVPFDVRLVDFYTMSSHKIHGPKGIGALYIRKGVRVIPRQIGGGQEKGLRSGTENTLGIAGFGQAVRDMRMMRDMSEKLMETKCAFIDQVLARVPGACVNGTDPREAAPHIVNISFPKVRGEVMLHALEAEHVYCSTGSACSSKKRHVSAVLTAMGINAETAEGALRFSFSPLTTMEEVQYAAEQIEKCYAMLKQYQRR